ncbi:CDP-diacylglycerol-glycerol-3-phosphate3-phosphatidyltransferase [Schizosaccharomyces cryophilus OY26]|uniref:CDP-diacylglycerol--glycerol-3-phosphate 3-phosphatidyltransferase n=1 Tax=Schizosaccharomyces cryophilus (strain OY26 / ATCC MYA-4695 / CBS 11777 / NBRC 106824 / NRRL Y48691) TaxID=653667 RepID=S9W4M2_SCHCR|nr:CDP-diacylglycerol-glycerol-3-phosphate3-phosphatidyltransferase [Schizosaccharomyces cryophilus OY26]EPY52855.1 CDP-diacylglycerol-glycerol-3-phosphate3-phosphatidyltransferase [Schizosaccharomyces cryophilus OY26]
MISLPERQLFTKLETKIDAICPKFYIDAGNIQVLHEPSEFYQTLKDLIKNAENRIFLSTLYIGKEENEFVNVIRQAMIAKPKLQVFILADQLRSTREFPFSSSASLLTKLREEFPERCEIKLYHTPNLRGLKKRLVPKRFNEGWGLQHMKIYGADDSLIISGANLSRDYFTNRKDRYYLFHDKNLSEFFFHVHSTFAGLSFDCLPSKHGFLPTIEDSLASQFRLEWNNDVPNPLTNSREFIKEASNRLQHLLCSSQDHTYQRDYKRPLTSSYGSSFTEDTQHENKAMDQNSYERTAIVYPLFQCMPVLTGQVQSTEDKVLDLLGNLIMNEKIEWTLTAGYFNVYPELRRQLLKSKGTGEAIVASQQANGFYKSKGPSHMIPPAYQYIAEKFLIDATRMRKDIDVLQWQRPGHTYHAKGFWFTYPGRSTPFLTTIGSSNYTSRSRQLDLESTLVIMTQNQQLQSSFQKEVQLIRQYAKPMGSCNLEKVPVYVKALAALLRKKL